MNISLIIMRILNLLSGQRKLKAVVDTKKCMGCGLCIIGCEQIALKFDLVKPPEYLKGPDTLPEMGERPVWEAFSAAPQVKSDRFLY
jgi:ferredoxin